MVVEARFFKDQAALRRWLERNHDRAPELWVGLWKKGSRKPSVTWPEVVDQSLCFGWIDGIRKSLGPDSYANRITPRRRGSTWSVRNVTRVRELIAQGLMHPAGLAAFEARDARRMGSYSYEQRPETLPAPYLAELRTNPRATEFWRSAPPSYRKAAVWWIVSAKREETRARRLATLIESSARGERVPPLQPPRT